MVIDEPDSYEMENAEDLGIDIFEPGTYLEGEMDGSHFTRVLMVVAAGWGSMLLIEVFLMIPVIMYLGIDAIYSNAWVLIYLSLAEIGFIFPVAIYLPLVARETMPQGRQLPTRRYPQTGNLQQF